MKRASEARFGLQLVAVVAAAVALALAAATSVAHAVSPVVKLDGDVSLSTLPTSVGGGGAPARFRVDAAFSTDTPGAELFTIQQAVIFFPDHSGTNGRLFASCSAQQIERFHGDVTRCPKGSKIGSGTLRATALQLGITANGRVTLFNSGGGRSITFNIQTSLPAYINESLDAPLTQLHGRYGEKLTLVVPPPLQEILSGVFVGLQDFEVTTTGAVRANGITHSYLKARTCPTQPLHAVFDFVNGTTGETVSTTADTRVRCTTGRPQRSSSRANPPTPRG
jgi:hypothetical protein